MPRLHRVLTCRTVRKVRRGTCLRLIAAHRIHSRFALGGSATPEVRISNSDRRPESSRWGVAKR